jgi:hypothetical protein
LSSTVVKQLTYNPKFEGLNPAIGHCREKMTEIQK